MNSTTGLFVVLEGIDGAGTTTQAKMLHRHLESLGIESVVTNEPTDEPVGKLIRDALSGRVTSPRSGERIAFSERALCLLFAADRIEHSAVIEEARARGLAVVCDRYLLSSIAYQTLDPSISADRVIEVNRGCAVPDVTFFLKVAVEECMRRLENRRDTPTTYETKDTLDRIERNYEATRLIYGRTFGPVIEIDATRTPEEVCGEIIGHLSGYLPAAG